MHIHRYCPRLPSNLFLPGPTCRDEIRANAPHASGAVVLLLTRTTMNEPISANPSHLSAALGTFLSAIHHYGKESGVCGCTTPRKRFGVHLAGPLLRLRVQSQAELPVGHASQRRVRWQEWRLVAAFHDPSQEEMSLGNPPDDPSSATPPSAGAILAWRGRDR